MGTNCGCIKRDQETELVVSHLDIPMPDSEYMPQKRANLEEHFNQFISSLPTSCIQLISSAAIKVCS
jgi:hypothetical protein